MKALLALIAAGAISILAPPPTAQDVRAQLSAYLTAYEPKLSELIADEQLLQRDEPKRGRPGTRASSKRALFSEVAFVVLPANAGWLGFRRVMKVDDAPVEDALGSLNSVLATGAKDDYARARAMVMDSARFNLGTRRTINLPNLPLDLLRPQNANQFSIRVAGSDRIDGHRTTKLVLVEDKTPTLVHAFDGSQMRAIVSAFVEEGTGRLWRADVIIRDPRPEVVEFDHIISVTFEENRALGLLVPAKMREDFFAGEDRKAWGDAVYSNYRRFQTSARIVPQ